MPTDFEKIRPRRTTVVAACPRYLLAEGSLLGSFFEGDAEAQAGPIEQDATPLLPQLISARERFAADLLTGMPIRFGVASQGQIRWS